MAEVVLEGVEKSFGKVAAVKDFNIQVHDKEFTVLVGPSGCGKSTLLRMVAGLEEVTKGRIYISGKLVNNLHPKDRDIAMVFQDYGLYPHMSVYNNMAFGLKLKKVPKAEIEQRVNEAADILGIKDLYNRKPQQLSGGQRQRVALGRAIVRKPAIFLFDEPLSNLDAKLRVQMRAELIKLHERLQSTVIYVTHDQVEAMTMGSEIVIMKDGTMQQVGSPLEVYRLPTNHFVAGFIGNPPTNFIPSRILARENSLYLHTAEFQIPIPKSKIKQYEPFIGQEVIFGIRPENVCEKTAEMSCNPNNIILVEIDLIEVLGDETLFRFRVGDSQVVGKTSPLSRIRAYDKIQVAINMDEMHIFEREPPHLRVKGDDESLEFFNPRKINCG